MAEKIRILIIDDHPVIREAFSFFLQACPDMEVVGTAQNGQEGLEKLQALAPDIIILDWAMPEMGGQECLPVYRERLSEARIVIFSAAERPGCALQALQAGARGYVVKCSPLSELVEGIRKVHQGGFWVSPGMRTEEVDLYLKNPEAAGKNLPHSHDLTSREYQVLCLLIEGKTILEIGRILGINQKTADKHRCTLMKKLGAQNPVDLVKFAVSRGLVDVEQWKRME